MTKVLTKKCDVVQLKPGVPELGVHFLIKVHCLFRVIFTEKTCKKTGHPGNEYPGFQSLRQ
jgi:hypothetical protein